jgi:hypothetical protein
VNIAVFRKPTFTDTIIPYTSNHPTQHKFAAIRFLYNRLNSDQLHETEHQREENFIQNILHNKSFPIPPQKPKTLFDPPPPQGPHEKLTTFTYTGPESTYITKLFKHINLKIAYCTSNNIQSYLTQNTHTKEIYAQSGVYKLNMP